MKKKLAILILMLIAVFAAVTGLSACAGAGADYSGMTKVTFVYNIGEDRDATYKNSIHPIVYYYNIAEGETVHIRSPFEIMDDENAIARSGYDFLGWYRDTDFSREFDFESDTVGKEGITLYARWKKKVNYSYVVCYKDEDGTVHELGRYEDREEGAKFNDYRKFYRRDGYTMLRYMDENGNTWDDNFGHPGGETDTEVRVFVEYIEGEYTLISKASEFTRYFSGSARLYLLDDIDLGGARFDCLQQSSDGGVQKFTGEIAGNNHTLSNFTLNYKNTRTSLVKDEELANVDNAQKDNILVISMFGAMDGATITDLTISGVKLDVGTGLSLVNQIVVAPLAVKISNSTLNNVKFTGTYTVSRLPDGFDQSDLTISQELYYYRAANDASAIENCECSFTDITGAAETAVVSAPIEIRKKKSDKENA